MVNSTKSTAQRFTNALSFQTRTSIGRAFGAELQPQNRPPSEALLASHAANRAAQCIRTAKRMIALLEPACLSYDELVEKSQGSPRFQFCQMHCSTHPYGTTHQGSSFESGALVGYCAMPSSSYSLCSLLSRWQRAKTCAELSPGNSRCRLLSRRQRAKTCTVPSSGNSLCRLLSRWQRAKTCAVLSSVNSLCRLLSRRE